MATKTGGYRYHRKRTAAAATDTHDTDAIKEGHKVYIDLVGFQSSRANADVVVYLVSGGRQHLVACYKNVSADLGEVEEIKTWLYTGESLRFVWSGLTAADTIEVWAVGTDKWGDDIDQGNYR